MPPYRGPERGSIPYKFKWVKVEEQLFACVPNERIEHEDLGRQDGIYEALVFYGDNPIKPDGGRATVIFQEGTNVPEIRVWGNSARLRLPPVDHPETREHTIKLFQKLSPGCIIVDLSATHHEIYP